MSIFALENKGIKSMKKSLFLTLGLLMLASFANAQEYIEPTEKWKNAEVWGNNYHGWSFHQDWEVDFTVENQDGRFTAANMWASPTTVATISCGSISSGTTISPTRS